MVICNFKMRSWLLHRRTPQKNGLFHRNFAMGLSRWVPAVGWCLYLNRKCEPCANFQLKYRHQHMGNCLWTYQHISGGEMGKLITLEYKVGNHYNYNFISSISITHLRTARLRTLGYSVDFFSNLKKYWIKIKVWPMYGKVMKYKIIWSGFW